MNSSYLLGPKPPGMPINSLAFKEEAEAGRWLEQVVMPHKQAKLKEDEELYYQYFKKRENMAHLNNATIRKLAHNKASGKRITIPPKGGKRKTHKRKTLKRKTHKRR